MAYPVSLDELTDGVPSDGTAAATSLGDATYQHDDHHRALAVAVEAVEAELGTAPSGASATVAARFGTFTADTFTGPVSFANGSAAAPSVAFASDTDTGLYRVGANSLGLSAGGAVRLTLDTAATFTGGISLTGTASVADRKITMQGTQVAYLPKAADFPNCIFFGNGGTLVEAGADSLTAVGIGALAAVTSGSYNVAVGRVSLAANTTGVYNVAVGVSSLGANVSGGSNVAVGQSALAATLGSYNVGVGRLAGSDITSGASNVMLGNSTGGGITTGSGNTVLGAGITGLAAGLADTAIIGSGGVARLTMDATGTGFNGAAVSAKPTITGSRGSNAALADLLTKLATIGLLTDSTS